MDKKPYFIAISCALKNIHCMLFVLFSLQGVQLGRNVSELHRFMKNQIQIYVPKRSRTYEKHLLDLLKSSIPDIFTSTLTIFSVKTLEKLCRNT